MLLAVYGFLFFVSLWFGNFITSFYFRIPRGISLNGRTNPPMCSNCGVKLKYPDYGPLYYYLFKGRACKICGSKIPFEYFFIETITAVMCLVAFLMNGLVEGTFLMIFVLLSYILVFVINLKHGEVPEKALWIATTATVIYVVYSFKFETSLLFLMATRLLIGFAFAFVIQKIILQKRMPPGYTPMFAVLSMVQLHAISLLVFVIMAIIALVFRRKITQKYLMSETLIIFTTLLILNPSTPFLQLVV